MLILNSEVTLRGSQAAQAGDLAPEVFPQVWVKAFIQHL